MPASTIVHFLPLIAALGLAVYTDCAARRIPNWLTITLAWAGLINSFVWGFPLDPLWASLGFYAGFLLMFPKFLINAAAGGDVKIMAAIGAWVGPLAVLQVFLIYQVLGLFIVLFMAYRSGRLTKLISNSMLITANVLSLKQVGREHVIETGQASRSLDRYMPDAVPMFAATLLVLAMNVFGSSGGG